MPLVAISLCIVCVITFIDGCNMTEQENRSQIIAPNSSFFSRTNYLRKSSSCEENLVGSHWIMPVTVLLST